MAWLFEQVTYHCGLKLINDDGCDYYAHPVIRRISARAFREHGIVFQSMEEVKRDGGLVLLNNHGDL